MPRLTFSMPLTRNCPLWSGRSPGLGSTATRLGSVSQRAICAVSPKTARLSCGCILSTCMGALIWLMFLGMGCSALCLEGIGARSDVDYEFGYAF
jgi:hypothetical protein